MHLFVWIFCTTTLLFSAMMPSQQFSEKLIVSYGMNEAEAQEDLLKLKVYFIENGRIRTLQEKNHLRLEIDKLNKYFMVVIKPISSLDLRNELLILLTPLFKDIFFIDYKKCIENIAKIPKITPVTLPIVKQKKEVLPINKIGLQWLALLLLSFVGLLLSIASRKKIIRLGNKQKDLQKKQTNIETEIKKLGVNNV